MSELDMTTAAGRDELRRLAVAHRLPYAARKHVVLDHHGLPVAAAIYRDYPTDMRIAAYLAAAANAVPGLLDRVEALEAEVGQLRETNRRLNRRCQDAEAALPQWHEIDLRKFVSGNYGRALLAWALSRAKEDAAELRAELERLRSENKALMPEKKDE